jgi:signal transduction histidine kinase
MSPPPTGTVDAVRHGRALRVRLRIAAFIALAAGLVFLPIEIYFRPATDRRALLLGWAIHTTLATAALVASTMPLGPTQIGRLVLAIVLVHIANAHLYLLLAPHNPAVVASGLICLLVVGPVFFSWGAARTLGVAAITCIVFAMVGFSLPAETSSLGSVMVALGALAVGSGIAVASARVLSQLRANLARRRRELAALSTRLMSVQEEERRRLSRELHDEFGQSLTAVNAYLWLIERQSPPEPPVLRERTAEARRVVSRTLAAMRELSQLLRPSVLDDFGLVPSLDSHLRSFAARHQIEATFSADELPDRLPPDMETALYRITQEALTNVARHAHASRVRVALVVRGGDLWLEIEDDGVGLPTRNGGGGRPGTGLVGIRERVRALGGTVTIHGRPGTRLRIAVPLPERQAGAG